MTKPKKIIIKTPKEIAQMRTAGHLASQVLDMITPHVQPGVSTGELNDLCHQFMVEELQVIPAPLHYRGFPKSICTSVNHVVCHGVPGKKTLKKGDIINIDVTVIKNGFHGDCSRMFQIGQPSVLAKRLCQVTYDAMCQAIRLIQPGVKLVDLGHCIQNHVAAHRFSVVRDFCGHGIGRRFHEPPEVLHFKSPDKGIVLQEGMTFTVEPMINAGKHVIKILPDGWTAVTKDHSLSAQWEHTVAVTKDGYEVLTLSQGEHI